MMVMDEKLGEKKYLSEIPKASGGGISDTQPSKSINACKSMKQGQF